MMLYTLKTVALVNGVKENLGFTAWLVELLDTKGLDVTIEDGRDSFYLAVGYVESSFATKGLDIAYLTESQIYFALSKATFDCVLIYKQEGETFIAEVAQGLVNNGTKKTPKWETPKVGSKYTYQETGLMPNWSLSNSITFPDDVFHNLEDQIQVAKEKDVLLKAKLAKIEQE